LPQTRLQTLEQLFERCPITLSGMLLSAPDWQYDRETNVVSARYPSDGECAEDHELLNRAL
jgi:hypothetical protein